MQTILPQIQLGKGVLLNPLTSLEKTMLTMAYYTVWGKGLGDLGNRFASIEKALYYAIDEQLLYQELMDLLEYQYMKIDFCG